MAVISNRSYVDKLNSARIYCCFAYDDANLFKIIAADVFSNYDKELFISFRKDVPIGDKSTGTDLSGDLLEAKAMILIVSNHNHSDFYRYVPQTFYADTIRFGLKFIFSSI